MSGTPRTDAALVKDAANPSLIVNLALGHGEFSHIVRADFARELEKEAAAWRGVAKQYEDAHKLFDWDLVKLLQRCQSGEATCIFTAQVIEKEMEELLEQIRDAIGILDGNQPPIKWREGGPELLRKLCEHLEWFRELENEHYERMDREEAKE